MGVANQVGTVPSRVGEVPRVRLSAALRARTRVAARLAVRQIRSERQRASLVALVVAAATAVLAFTQVTQARASVPGATLSVAGSGSAAGGVVLDPASLTNLTVAASLAVALAALLIAPAFLISLERRLHDLGLLAAVGARSTDLAATVVAEGLVLGVTGSACGAALAVTASYATVPVGSGPEWAAMARAATLAVAAGTGLTLAAGTLPAVRALTARPGQTRVPQVRRRPTGWWTAATTLISLACLVGGWAFALRGAAVGTPVLLPTGVIAAQVGAVVCVDLLVRLGGRVSTRRFLTTYVLRDAARHRARVVPAAASAMTAITVAAAVLVYQSSMHSAEARQRSEGEGVATFAGGSSIVVAVFAAAIVYAALAVSAVLAAQETRSEASALEALGASVQTQRRIAASQASVVAGLGSVFGVFGGVGLGAVLLEVQERLSLQGVRAGQLVLEVPVPALLLLVTVVPGAVVFAVSRRAAGTAGHRIEKKSQLT